MAQIQKDELKRLAEAAKEREENGNLFEAAHARKAVTDVLSNDAILALLDENQRMLDMLDETWKALLDGNRSVHDDWAISDRLKLFVEPLKTQGIELKPQN
jgi:hypothetical protein